MLIESDCPSVVFRCLLLACRLSFAIVWNQIENPKLLHQHEKNISTATWKVSPAVQTYCQSLYELSILVLSYLQEVNLPTKVRIIHSCGPEWRTKRHCSREDREVLFEV